MPKVELFNRDEILQKAMNLFWLKGYKGTSLIDLTDTLEIGKGSFYNTFKSKRALFEQCIDIYRNNSINSLKEILNAEKNIKDGLQTFLILNLEYAMNDTQQKGCFLTNTCTELAGNDEEISQVMNDHYNAMKELIADYLKQNSELQDIITKEIADTIITFFIGITVEVKLHYDKTKIESSINRLLQSLF